MLFISSRKLFAFSSYSIFCISVFLSFFPVGHCFRGWSKMNIRVYDVISCLNKDLVAYFVWYLEKEIRFDIWTLSIDGVLNKKFFYGKHLHQKLVPVPFLILVNNPKQPFHTRNYSKNTIFWNRLSKTLKKSNLFFFFRTQSLLMELIIKEKRGLKLVTAGITSANLCR